MISPTTTFLSDVCVFVYGSVGNEENQPLVLLKNKYVSKQKLETNMTDYI